MSETVHYKGTLTLLKGEGTIEDIFLSNVDDTVVKKYNEYIDKYNLKEECIDTKLLEFFLDNLYQQYYLVGNKIYKVEKQSIGTDGDIFNAKKLSDDTIEFEVKYYNGGCSFDEAIDDAMGNIK